MTIGTRILQAREESGLSQRQVAGEHMTRNMLSSLEHDKAKPSLDTLCYLSRVLDKPVGWFLGEDGPQIRGLDRFRAARECYDLGSWRECLDHLSQIPEDEVLGREAALLGILARLELGEQCLSDGRLPYARADWRKPWNGSRRMICCCSRLNAHWIRAAIRMPCGICWHWMTGDRSGNSAWAKPGSACRTTKRPSPTTTQRRKPWQLPSGGSWSCVTRR